MIKTPEKLSNYCIVCNEVAQRKDLSAKAKGIYYYLATLPSDWKIYQKECVNHFTDGRESISSGFNELIKHGYLIKVLMVKKNFKESFYAINNWSEDFNGVKGYKKYLKTRHWRSVKKIAIKKHGSKCLSCGSSVKIDIHHKCYKHKGFEQYFLDDLQPLCRSCHNKIHNKVD